MTKPNETDHAGPASSSTDQLERAFDEWSEKWPDGETWRGPLFWQIFQAGAAAERERWERIAMTVVAAVEEDKWCQECALENVRPAVAALLALVGPNAG